MVSAITELDRYLNSLDKRIDLLNEKVKKQEVEIVHSVKEAIREEVDLIRRKDVAD